MANDYISREAVVKNLLDECVIMGYGGLTPRDVTRVVACTPNADVVERKRGEWIGESDGYADGNPVYDIWSCSCCGRYFDEWDEMPTWNFCPVCGADMRGDE